MVRVILILLVLLILQVRGGLSLAHDHPAGDGSYRQREDRKAQQVDHDRKKGKGEKGEEGNEATGQGAAWLLVSANVTIVLSILIKKSSPLLPVSPRTTILLKTFNQAQKRYLMRLHDVLNPMALCAAFFHFLLSSCRSSSLPEWGLIGVTMLVLLGLVLKFKIAPVWMRRVVYRLHTSPVTFSTVILLLVVGHLISD